jgi:GT2 family glycosyltransferase
MGDLVQRCLTLVLNTDYPNYEVIFVDDASIDGSFEIVQSLYGSDPHFKIIRNTRNYGAAATRNVGISASSGELVAMLDIDAEVHPKWLSELVKVILSDPMIGAAQSKMVSFDRKHVMCAGEKIIPYLGWPVLLGPYRENDSDFDKIIDILGSSGALAFKREAADRVGHFDPKLLHVQFEDMDFSWRMWIGGYRVVLAPESIVHHEGSWRPMTPGKRKYVSYVVQRNFIRVLLKNHGNENLAKYFLLSIAGTYFRALFHLGKRRDPYPITGLTRAIFWNLKVVRDTLGERRRIQRLVRKVPDSYIIERVGVRLSPLRVYRDYLKTGRV